jgi:soluble lytic murein transglycosylase-like protein
MKKFAIIALFVIGAALGIIWWFDIEQAGDSVSTLWDWVTGNTQGVVGYVTGSNLQYSDLVTLAQNAGFDDTDTAAAIALAESSGNPNAVGDLTLGGSYGLWQINLKAHPEYADNPDQLFDPATNADAAYSVYQSQGFQAWTTYNTGAYQKYSQGTQVATNSDSDVTSDTSDGSAQS